MSGQNLIPNFSFETYTQCPTFASQLNYASPWFNPTQGTPEYFNACATNHVSVPAQPSGGYQYAKTGEGYAGIFTYRKDVEQMREYISIPITNELVKSNVYYFEMYLNQPNDHKYAADGIGVYFSNERITTNNPKVLPVTPQLSNPTGNIISDTLNWVLFSGCYSAKGGEKYITIGNYKRDEDVTYTTSNTSAYYQHSAYMLIDDVKLMLAIEYFNLGNDTVLCYGKKLTLTPAQQVANYTWQDGSVSNSFIPEQSGKYWATANNYTCSLSDTIQIAFTNCDCTAFVPTAFTPNKDLLNEIFQANIGCNEVIYFNFSIFNRWGEKVFQSTDRAKGWNGNIGGKPAAQDTYVWTLEYKVRSGSTLERFFKKGNVTLIR